MITLHHCPLLIRFMGGNDLSVRVRAAIRPSAGKKFIRGSAPWHARHHQMFRVALAALAAVIVAGHGAALAASADKGKAAFMKYGCWQCHGTQGQGSVATSNGKVLAPDPLPYESFSAYCLLYTSDAADDLT